MNQPVILRPAIWPQDAVDLVHGGIVLAVYAVVSAVLGLVSYAGLSVAGLLPVESRVAAALCIAMLPLLSIPLFIVWYVKVDADGIEFRRGLGSPRVLRWENIATIRAATRYEVLLHGWLWPLFPPREMTLAMSSVGHYRIEAVSGRYTFYPPQDGVVFCEALSQFAPPNPALQPTAAEPAAAER